MTVNQKNDFTKTITIDGEYKLLLFFSVKRFEYSVSQKKDIECLFPYTLNLITNLDNWAYHNIYKFPSRESRKIMFDAINADNAIHFVKNLLKDSNSTPIPKKILISNFY